jgi:hypothetical protein
MELVAQVLQQAQPGQTMVDLRHHRRPVENGPHQGQTVASQPVD